MKLIGITADIDLTQDKSFRHELRCRYTDAILKRGAIPIIIPNAPDRIDEYIELIDGLIISGGGIIKEPSIKDIERYKDSNYVVEYRTYFEYKLIKKALEVDLPVLGICFGEQLINLVYGGSIKSNVKNHKENVYDCSHIINIKKDSLLYDIVKSSNINVNTSHTQAVDVIGAGLDAVALSKDGFVEAIEDKTKTFCIGVQWHPEASGITEKSDEIFDYFLNL
ncbi:MAG: gamma-glutamyl-gamma-aminobutyrate hydrolase family protein [Alphaproteobacteria bacterium]|jgi:putative glutamine amidotransferase|nr:gamma-glutamyl-gamma-aminobutyrate hydrolase family protein [Alphaproteobacteria bacterium]